MNNEERVRAALVAYLDQKDSGQIDEDLMKGIIALIKADLEAGYRGSAIKGYWEVTTIRGVYCGVFEALKNESSGDELRLERLERVEIEFINCSRSLSESYRPTVSLRR